LEGLEKLKRALLSAESFFHRAHDAATARIATVALAFANFSPGFATPVRSQRAAHVHFFLKLTCLAPAYITTVALMRFNRCSFAALTAFTCANASS
jgi:hypothetical protein